MPLPSPPFTGIPTGGPWAPGTATPIDNRMVVANAAARAALVTGNVAYIGMVVFQVDTEENWQLGADGTTWTLFGTGGGSSGGKSSIIFQRLGDLNVYISTQRYTSVGTTHLDSVLAVVCKDVPVGSDIIIDMLRNGSDSLWSDPGLRPVINEYGVTSNLAVPDLITTLTDGQYIVPEIVQVGASIPGSDIVIQLQVH